MDRPDPEALVRLAASLRPACRLARGIRADLVVMAPEAVVREAGGPSEPGSHPVTWLQVEGLGGGVAIPAQVVLRSLVAVIRTDWVLVLEAGDLLLAEGLVMLPSPDSGGDGRPRLPLAIAEPVEARLRAEAVGTRTWIEWSFPLQPRSLDDLRDTLRQPGHQRGRGLAFDPEAARRVLGLSGAHAQATRGAGLTALELVGALAATMPRRSRQAAPGVPRRDP